jgi:hypothetical protein
VAAFDLETGELRWGAGDRWGPSCASPVLASLAGRERILVLTGGESRPPTGGLMVLSLQGALTWEYPFRSRTTLSVNGASPVAVGDSVFLTAAYNTGSALVDVDAAGLGTERWRDRDGLSCEFSTPVRVGDVLVAVEGISGRAGALVAVDPWTGADRARRELDFEPTFGTGADARTLSTSLGNGSLVLADGVLWVLGDTGHLVTARLVDERFELVEGAPLFLAQETWTPPVISGGLLYVCQNTPGALDGTPRRLLCYDVRGSG